MMELKKIAHKLTVCKVADLSEIDLTAEFYFIGKTDGWRGFRIQGVLDFSLIGILSELSGILAEHEIGIFAVSTYNTDYILVKEENYERASEALASEGYAVV